MQVDHIGIAGGKHLVYSPPVLRGPNDASRYSGLFQGRHSAYVVAVGSIGTYLVSVPAEHGKLLPDDHVFAAWLLRSVRVVDLQNSHYATVRS